MPALHVRHNGTSHEIPFEQIFTPENLAAAGINEGVASTAMSSQNVKQLSANYIDCPLSDFDAYEVDFHKNLNITLRPEAEFGV
jgi:hypothetical protein